MQERQTVTIDGNEAAASAAFRLSEIVALYPITPSSPMGEWADDWAAKGQTNIWGGVPTIAEMQSEAGAAGAVHGALQGGALATTFTASQGLLLMIPNMYKIAGELTPYCVHVAARSVATHALSIFCDHSDVMACRHTGFAMLAARSVQEAHDMACIGTAASLESRVPFLHFFDGFRTSHEIAKIELLSDDDLRAMVSQEAIDAHRDRGLTPDAPELRGSAQNPDVFFQAREACNPFYEATPEIFDRVLARFAELTGRAYLPFEYSGHPQAERVIVIIGSAAETVAEAVDHLVDRGEKVGVLNVRLYRPFSTRHFVDALPESVRALAVLDRTKEPGALGEPLWLDVVGALEEAFAGDAGALPQRPVVVGGRYGLSSKEFTPSMVMSVFDELTAERPQRRFTVGIVDDVSKLSLDFDTDIDIEPDDVVRAVFFGLGADGTVGANKNSIKIIGEQTDHYVQGYFVYDSKKSGAMTISHLRFGPRPIRSTYLIKKASFVACHQFGFLERIDVLDYAADGAVFLLNSPYPADEVWDKLPREVQQQIIDKGLQVWVIDAVPVAEDAGMGKRINTIMQTCFFALSGVLPRDEAIACIKRAIEKTYKKKGDEVVRRNWAAVDAALDHLHQVEVPDEVTGELTRPPIVPQEAPDFVHKVTALMLGGKGDLLPVSAFPPDGTWPTATSRWEKRGIAERIPIWDAGICIQCNKCALVCPHAAIRAKVYEPDALHGAPESFTSREFRSKEMTGLQYTIQVAPEDCTGCTLCVSVCPAKDKANPRHKAINMESFLDNVDRERSNYDFFLDLPEIERTRIDRVDLKSSQLFQPLFEYNGACAGCGETPYLKLMTQLYGDRAIVANATGCSSIYGGNLPTTPYCVDPQGRGPAWSNSLFEDNAEFGFGIRLAVDAHAEQARELLRGLAPRVGDNLVDELLAADQYGEANVAAQRQRVVALREKLAGLDGDDARRLDLLADYLVRKSVWLVGGDGWAYDIGYGGLDHVLSMDRDVNVLVLDTEVYSNTGGQASKATPLGAAAKFAAKGKEIEKKDLGLMAMSYGHVYVASIALGAKDTHTVKALLEADSWPGPSLIIAYSHCIAHGYDLAYGLDQQDRAVKSGVWSLYRWDPRRLDEGEPPLVVDAQGGKLPVPEYMKNEMRFRVVEKVSPERFRKFARDAQLGTDRRLALYRHLAQLRMPAGQPQQEH
jgi:pyruvate-ferredoxin/flavodoxin oxidoreductase